MNPFEPKSALYEKVHFFKGINLALVLFDLGQTRPDQSGHGFNSLLRNMIIFSLFKFIILCFLCMNLWHTYIDKQESNVLGDLLLITRNIWTVCLGHFGMCTFWPHENSSRWFTVSKSPCDEKSKSWKINCDEMSICRNVHGAKKSMCRNDMEMKNLYQNVFC